MHETSAIFFLCLFAIVNVASADNSKYFKPGQATDEDVKSLLEITSKQALPVIMFETEGNQPFQFFIGITQAEVKDGRIASGTKFYSRSSESQMFFCPKSEPQTGDKCLVPKKFKESQPLECDVEPVPTLIHSSGLTCGATGEGNALRLSYIPYSYKTHGITLYTICYDKLSNRVLQVGYTLVAADLFQEKLFTREREIKFEMNRETYGHIDANYYANLEAEIKQRPKYELQMLVPIDDMALATWRKSTRYFANYALQHEGLTDLWDDITSIFRNHAIKRKGTLYQRITGVTDVPKDELIFTQVDESQKANIWITVMLDAKVDLIKGLAVIMHNFITDDSKKQVGDTETLNQQYIDKLCGESLCVQELKKKFENAGTQGRCCKVTKNIYELLIGKEENVAPFEVLHVENINYSW